MRRTRAQLIEIAGRVALVGAVIGMAAGIAQATVGSHIPNWSGHKAHPLALGLLAIAMSAGVLVAVRTLRSPAAPRDEALAVIALWLVVVAAICSTTVGRLWVFPGVLLLGAAGGIVVACGWHRFRLMVATRWLRGLLGILGGLELLMAVSAGPVVTIAAGIIAGMALIAAAVVSRPVRWAMVGVLVAASLPFAVLTWWTIVTPLVSVVALAIGVATTRHDPRRAATDVAQVHRPVGAPVT